MLYMTSGWKGERERERGRNDLGKKSHREYFSTPQEFCKIWYYSQTLVISVIKINVCSSAV